ncbi:hypothetical protein GCM10007269_18040 [Microbacterium murale]|uniref:Oligosaccharide repeat unit polymerase n=1 Tax=Microbacterium murale TaxID=1081040 RepID=A0ABQ1RPS4_9MICO|nr:hypothetical protein GCM10007269_18040 [Microbacterium murale]
MILIGVAASVLLMFPAISAYSGYSLTDVSSALADQGAAFEQSSQRILEGTDSRTGLLLVQSLLAPLTLVALPLAALYWFERRRGLVVFLIALAVPVVTSIMVGRDQQLGWALIVVGAAWVISRYRRDIGIRWRDMIVLVGSAVIFALLFAMRKASRGLEGAFCPPGAVECLGMREERTLFDAAFQSMASYMSQGMEGLGRAFETEWAFGGGLAHSPAVNDLLARLFGFQEAPSVSAQLGEVGWSATWYWSTAITSFANDIPWILIPFLFILQGLVLGSSWVSSLRDGDFLSVGVFVLTWLGVLYTPQNLQLAASGPTYIGYVVLLLAYIFRAGLRQLDRAPRGARRAPRAPGRSAVLPN